MGKPKMYRLSEPTDKGRYRFDRGKLGSADLVIDHKGVVIKDRFGNAPRDATRTELQNAELVN